MSLGIFEALGFVITWAMIGIIVWFIIRGRPNDMMADLRAWGENLAH